MRQQISGSPRVDVTTHITSGSDAVDQISITSNFDVMQPRSARIFTTFNVMKLSDIGDGRNQRHGPSHRTLIDSVSVLSILRVVHPVEHPHGLLHIVIRYIPGWIFEECWVCGVRPSFIGLSVATCGDFARSPFGTVRLGTVSRFVTVLFSLEFTYPSPTRV